MNSLNDALLTVLIDRYDSHTESLFKIISEITEKELNRFGNDSKNIPWIIGSQIQLRFEVINLFGINIKQDSDALFSNNQGVQVDLSYPALPSLNKDWIKVSPILKSEILELGSEDLFIYSENLTKMSGTFFDLLSYMIERESKCISILTIWRGLLT